MHLSRVWVVCSKTVLWSDALVLPAIGGSRCRRCMAQHRFAERSFRGRFAAEGPYPFYWISDTSRVNPAYRQGRFAALDLSLLKKIPRRVSGAGPNGRRSWKDLSTGGRAPLSGKISLPGWRGEQIVRARQIAAQCCGSFLSPQHRSVRVIQ